MPDCGRFQYGKCVICLSPDRLVEDEFVQMLKVKTFAPVRRGEEELSMLSEDATWTDRVQAIESLWVS